MLAADREFLSKLLDAVYAICLYLSYMKLDRLSFLEENAAAAAREAREALEARDAGQTRLDRANQAQHAWNVLLAQERELQGVQPPAPGPVESIAESVDRENRTEYVRSILKIAGANGTTAAEILRISRTDNPDIVVPNYPYGQLSKLKASGEVVSVSINREGRYILKDFLDGRQAAPE